jgi:NhaP-type Na+/H+ or K+/H+ antiporter
LELQIPYIGWLFAVGLACLGAALLPHLLKSKPISFPMVFIVMGILIALIFRDASFPQPDQHMRVIERITELLVIISLMGVGLRIDTPLGFKAWASTWKLLGITMPACIGLLALLSWWLLGLSPEAAILLGAVLAPTDPVLASEVQSLPPLTNRKNEVRFALTSEAGFNDGLAFPFTNLALALAAASPGYHGWFQTWLWSDIIYKIGVGVVAGVVVGYSLAHFIFSAKTGRSAVKAGEGLLSIGATLTAYALTELIHGYGFLAVFITAVMFRHYERQHRFHRILHEMSENMERFFMAPLLVLFGCALIAGLLAGLTWKAALVGVIFILLIRPLSGYFALWPLQRTERAAIAFFGIRGFGSFYYLSYAANHGHFEEMELLWSTVSFVVLCSIFLHGVSATPVMDKIEKPK